MAAAERQLVTYRSQVYEVLMSYAYSLELRGEDGAIIRVPYGDPELDRAPSAEDVAAPRPAPTKRRR